LLVVISVAVEKVTELMEARGGIEPPNKGLQTVQAIIDQVASSAKSS